MTYLDGTLILMSPELIHDDYAELLGILIRATAKARRVESEGDTDDDPATRTGSEGDRQGAR